jgi:presenilin-like A22 family membrane protease
MGPLDSIYTAKGRRALLIVIISTALLTPALATAYLEPIASLFPIAVITCIYLVRNGHPDAIPTWVIFNAFSFYTIVYAAYSFGTTFQVELLILFLLGMIIYDTVGVKSGQMQSMAGKMIQYGVPLFILVPHTRSFSFDSFREIVANDGLEGLHESDHGISMLGVGDGFLPGALAVAVGTIGTTISVGPIVLTIPQLTTILGGILSLALLMWAELPRAIAALIVSVPGALLGLSIGLLIDPVAINGLAIPKVSIL